VEAQVGVVAGVRGEHDGARHVGVGEPQGVADLVHGDEEEVDALVGVDGPALVVVEVHVAALALARGEGVGQHVAAVRFTWRGGMDGIHGLAFASMIYVAHWYAGIMQSTETVHVEGKMIINIDVLCYDVALNLMESFLWRLPRWRKWRDWC
jgi:hypothetical protein